MTSQWFFRQSTDDLLYSPLKESAYCFCYLLYSDSPLSKRSVLEKEMGFRSWNKPEKLVQHENSLMHRSAFMVWKEVESRLTHGTSIDIEVQKRLIDY